MSAPDREQTVRLDVGECRCSGLPHPEDWVELRPKLSTAASLAVLGSISGIEDNPLLLQSIMTAGLIQLGISDWSFVDAKGNPERVTEESVERLIPWNSGGFAVGNKVWELYGDILDPLLAGRPRQSRNGQTANGTHRIRSTGSATPKSSPPSSVASTGTKRSEVPVS